MKEQEEVVTSTVRPEEIPPIPENRFLMRRSPQFQSKEGETDQQSKDERQRERFVSTNLANSQIFSRYNNYMWSSCSSRTMYNSQSGYQRRPVITRSGRKIKGRGQRVRPRIFSRNSLYHYSYAEASRVFLPCSGIGLRHGLVRGPETAIGAAKPHHAGVRKYGVRE